MVHLRTLIDRQELENSERSNAFVFKNRAGGQLTRFGVRASGTIIGLTYFLAVKAEALYLADRTSEALETILEAEAIVERSGFREWHAELHRLRGVFLTAIGADETHIETSFCEAIRIAREQKSIALGKRAEGTYEEYRRQKVNASGGRGFRLPLW